MVRNSAHLKEPCRLIGELTVVVTDVLLLPAKLEGVPMAKRGS